MYDDAMCLREHAGISAMEAIACDGPSIAAMATVPAVTAPLAFL